MPPPPPPKSYPPLSALHFHDPLLPSPSPSSTYSLSRALLRRESLSLRNRFKSIASDAAYVSMLRDALVSEFSSFEDEGGEKGGPTWPLIANERNGGWYVRPPPPAPVERGRGGVKEGDGEGERGGGKAYFKSTDGHVGRWGFSARRLNLGMLRVLGGGGKGGDGNGGAILVDSTRTGKLLPDALSKTVPIWTAVINAALFPSYPSSHALQTPPSFSLFPSDRPDTYLPASEISQITSLLPSFISSFHALALPLDTLRAQLRNKPVKLVWAVNGLPGLTRPEIEERDLERWNVLVLCSASRRASADGEDGYVQGAADDAEGWSGGLTAEGFWEVLERLGGWEEGLGVEELGVGEQELREMVEEEVRRARGRGEEERKRGVEVAQELFIEKEGKDLMERITEAGSLMVICNGKPPSEVADGGKLKGFYGERGEEDIANGANGQKRLGQWPSNQLYLDLPTGKLGSRALRKKLSQVEPFIRAALEKDISRQIVVTCETGKDLSVGVALMIVCLFYNDEGIRDMSTSSQSRLDKEFVRKRLVWIVEKMDESRTSRATLNAVNEFLMGMKR